MIKRVFILLAFLLAFSACQKGALPLPEDGRTYSLSELQFNFTIERGSNTKGVRTGWNNGDVVFIFIQGVNSAYLTVTYNGSAWSANPTQVVRDGESAPTLNESGYLTAVYLPYGNALTPTWDGTNEVWSFSGTNDYYYLKSENTEYFITDTSDALATLGAYLYMDTANGFVQFFLPDNTAAGTIQLACNALLPAGIASVSLNGTVNETVGTQGSWVTAHAETFPDGNVDEKGYYVTGKLSSRPGVLYYFAIDKGSGDDRYKHYFKQRSSALVSRGAYQLPAESTWLTVSPTTFVQVADYNWCTTNLGAATPWVLGTAKSSAEIGNLSLEGAAVPSDNEWDTLLDRTKTAWIQASLLGQDGFLVMDRSVPENYFFLPGVDYWSTTVADNFRHYLHTDDEGTHEIKSTGATPSTVYVRMISTAYGSGFNPPENGDDI